jgi:hypothetical protein
MSADLHRPGDQHVRGQPRTLADLDVVAAARHSSLPIKTELVHLVHAGEHADVVPEEHVLPHSDVTAAGVEDRIVDDRSGMDPQSGGVAVDAVAVQRVQAFLFDALRHQPSDSRPQQSVEQPHQRPLLAFPPLSRR